MAKKSKTQKKKVKHDISPDKGMQPKKKKKNSKFMKGEHFIKEERR